MLFSSKIFICRRAGVHDSCWMNFLTNVGNLEVLTTSWRKSARRVPLTDTQVVADCVRRELMKTMKQWMTLYWVRRTSPKRTDQRAKFHVKLAFTVPVFIGSFTVPAFIESFTVIFISSASSNVVHNNCLKPTSSPIWLAANSCWKGTTILQLISYGSQMEKCLPLNHHSLHRTIGSTCRSEPRSDSFNPAVCYTCARRSASPLWYRLPCQKWVWLSWCLSTTELKLTSTTTMSCCLSRWFQPSNR